MSLYLEMLHEAGRQRQRQRDRRAKWLFAFLCGIAIVASGFAIQTIGKLFVP